MKKVEFSIGDKVVTVKDGELCKGVIKNVYPLNPPICIIKFEDGTIEKIPFDKVVLEPKTETAEEKNEPTERSEITITPDEFKEITCRVAAEKVAKYGVAGIAFASMLLGDIHRALFVDAWENDNFFN